MFVMLSIVPVIPPTMPVKKPVEVGAAEDVVVVVVELLTKISPRLEVLSYRKVSC